MICMTKLFLLYLLSRMVTGVKTHSIMSVVLQTTKTFIHHTGSFFFIPSDAYDVIIITSIWRFISMNGHAILTMRKKLSNETYNRLMWIIAHMRNAIVVVVIALCLAYPTIRHGFALSACGHVAYMLVRMGPVFRIGSLYFPEESPASRWAALTDTQRLTELLSLKHPWFLLELGILFVACVYFLLLRVQLLLYGTV
uniref:Vomeronasal type-1 receptor n=1 Tax=Spumella elongata TaxID=89044 RepID=A0A7S3HSX0_9STRA